MNPVQNWCLMILMQCYVKINIPAVCEDSVKTQDTIRYGSFLLIQIRLSLRHSPSLLKGGHGGWAAYSIGVKATLPAGSSSYVISFKCAFGWIFWRCTALEWQNVSAQSGSVGASKGRELVISICSPARPGSSFFIALLSGSYYWRAIIFPSPVQHSIRLHVRWLWLMVAILFGHNVAVLGNWRWEQGWEIVIFNLYVLREDWASVLFPSHFLTHCLHSLYSRLVAS